MSSFASCVCVGAVILHTVQRKRHDHRTVELDCAGNSRVARVLEIVGTVKGRSLFGPIENTVLRRVGA